MLKLSYLRLSQLRQYNWVDDEVTREEFMALMNAGNDWDVLIMVAPLLEYQQFVEAELRSMNDKIAKYNGTDRANRLRILKNDFLRDGLVTYTTVIWNQLIQSPHCPPFDLFEPSQPEEVVTDVITAMM